MAFSKCYISIEFVDAYSIYVILIAFVRKHYIPKGGTKIHPAMKKQKKVIPRGGTKFCLKRTEPERTCEGAATEPERRQNGGRTEAERTCEGAAREK